MDWYGQFVKRVGFVGVILTLLTASFVVLLILMGILGDKGFTVLWNHLTVPADLKVAVRQPWSLFTYWLSNHPLGVWFLLMDMVVLYTFGKILNSMVGDNRMRGIVVMAILFNALITVGICSFLPTVELTPSLRLYGFGAMNATIIAAVITLVPRFNFRLLFWDVPLVFVGLFVLLASFTAHRLIFTMEGVAELVGAGLGFGLIKMIRQGWDLTNWFRGVSQRPQPPIPRQPEPVMSSQRPVVRTIHPKPKPVAPQPTLSEAEELDDLLDKINEVGYNSLTKAEKERLDLLSGK